MSFGFEFCTATADEARILLDKQHAPYCVKQFIRDALRATAGPVYVKAFGHLHDGSDYAVSGAQIEVKPIIFTRAPE